MAVKKQVGLDVFILTAMLTLNKATAQGIPAKCQAPAVTHGECVVLKDCPSVVTALDNFSLREFLRSYGCGVDSDGNVRLCCPEAIPSTGIVSQPSQPTNRSCGFRAVGQGPEWPFVAAVGRYSLQRGFEHRCNGAFLNERWVLVEGSCIVQYFISHVIPWSALANDKTDAFMAVVSKRLGEYTDDGRYSKGLALLMMENPLVFNENVQSVCLPVPQENENALLHAIGFVVRTKRIITKAVKVAPAASQECGSFHIPAVNNIQNPVFMCTTGAKMCGLDSLKPLVVEEDTNTGQFHIQGLGGFPISCTEGFNVYSDVKPHLGWIQQQMQDSSLTTIAHGFHQCGQHAVGDGPLYPFMVAIGRGQNDQFSITCGGVIIDPSWILTEAICMVESLITHVKIGLDSNAERTTTVASRIRHPSYDPITREANIGLLKLETPLSFDDNVQPACLPSTFDISGNVMSAVVVAAKRTKIPNWFKLQPMAAPVFHVGQAECEKDYTYGYNSDTICASGARVCIFASRIVLFSREVHTSSFKVEGLGGTSSRVCSADAQGYTRVMNYLQWIKDSLGR